jgi:hypothetical protein
MSPLVYTAVTVAMAVKEVSRVARSEAVLVKEPAVGVRVTVPGIGVPLFRNCTVPVGATPLDCVETTATRVRLALPAGDW